jgi:hypothetical protein
MKTKICFTIALASAMLVSFNSFGYQINTDAIAFNLSGTNPSDKAFEQYAALQKALAIDNAATAQKAAKGLVAALKEIPGSADAIKATTAISQTKDIAKQRKAYATLNEAIIKLFKAHKPENVMPYIHYCPMAKAYWLSDSKDIHNPYFGSKMPSCGKTTGMIM